MLLCITHVHIPHQAEVCHATPALPLQAQESQQNCPSFCKLADPLVLFLEIRLLIQIYSELVSRN